LRPLGVTRSSNSVFFNTLIAVPPFLFGGYGGAGNNSDVRSGQFPFFSATALFFFENDPPPFLRRDGIDETPFFPFSGDDC